jgi:hypothetical protein
MDPLCATFIPLDDPELAKRSKQMYTPYSLTEPYIVAHGGSSFGSPSFSPRTQLIYISGKNGAISLNVQPLGDSLRPGPHGGGHSDNFSKLDRLAEHFPANVTVSAYSPWTANKSGKRCYLLSLQLALVAISLPQATWYSRAWKTAASTRWTRRTARPCTAIRCQDRYVPAR